MIIPFDCLNSRKAYNYA